MFDPFKDLLDQAVADGPYLNGGICLIDADGWEHAHVTGLVHPLTGHAAPEPLTDAGLRMRMASMRGERHPRRWKRVYRVASGASSQSTSRQRSPRNQPGR